MRHIQTSFKKIRLVVDKITKWFDGEVLENINAREKLFKTLKSLSIPKKRLISNFNTIERNNPLTFDKKL